MTKDQINEVIDRYWADDSKAIDDVLALLPVPPTGISSICYQVYRLGFVKGMEFGGDAMTKAASNILKG